MGKMKFGLFGEVCPITAKNFAMICDRYENTLDIEGNRMQYAGTMFNTIVPGVMA